MNDHALSVQKSTWASSGKANFIAAVGRTQSPQFALLQNVVPHLLSRTGREGRNRGVRKRIP